MLGLQQTFQASGLKIVVLDGKGEAEVGGEGNYPNLPNCIDSDKHGVWRSVLELICMGTVDPMFSFSQTMHCCVISEQDGCSFCCLSCEYYAV